MADRLTAKGFREWLEAQPRRVPVGVQGSTDACPLARYLGPGWLVTPVMVWPDNQAMTGGRRVPGWATRFVRAVDALPRGRCRPNRRVSPHLALQLLDAAVREGDA